MEADSHVGSRPRIAWCRKELKRLEGDSLTLRVEDAVRGGYDLEDARMVGPGHPSLTSKTLNNRI